MNTNANVHAAAVVPPESNNILGLPGLDDVWDEKRQWMDASRYSPEPSSYACAAVSRLPPEILAHIFLLASGRPHFRSNKTEHRITVSHVCRHWRAAALNSPAVWSDLSAWDTTPAALPEFIARSAQAPLHVRCTPDMGSLGVFAPHLHRIRELWIVVQGEQSSAVYSWDAPLLEVLKSTRARAFPGSTVRQQLRLRVLAPSLRNMELDGVEFRWTDWGAFPRLAVLRIRQPQDQEKAVGTLSEMVATLGRLPALRELKLEYAVPPVPASAAPGRRRETLGKLESLRVDDTSASCAALLDHIVVPANVSVWLGLPEEPDSLEDVIGAAARLLHRAGSPPIKSLLFQLATDLHVELFPEMPNARALRPFGPSSSRAPLTVHITDGSTPRALLTTLLPRLSELSMVYLSSWRSPGLLFNFIRATRIGEARTVAIPALRELTVNLPYNPYGTWQQEIGDWVVERAAHGAPLARLELQRCASREADLAPLREIVGGLEIVWSP